jgi:iron complex transport system ATP-binding protein
LIKCLLGILPVSTGTIKLNRKSKACHPAYAYVPQSSTVDPGYTVGQVVVMGRRPYLKPWELPRPADYHQVIQVLRQLNITDWQHRPIAELSGGEWQLVLLARALVTQADILLLDEPTTSLDFRRQSEILQLIKSLATDHQKTIIFTTHHPEHANWIADWVLMMSRHKTEFGPTEEMITDEKLTELYGIGIEFFRITG